LLTFRAQQLREIQQTRLVPVDATKLIERSVSEVCGVWTVDLADLDPYEFAGELAVEIAADPELLQLQ